MENKEEEFKPYIPADKVTPEFTVTSIVTGVLLAVIFGAANAYLGLRVGMTVSASIPAAVISMGVIRVIMKKDSILESNMVQTIGSAGESLAAGAIFWETGSVFMGFRREDRSAKPFDDFTDRFMRRCARRFIYGASPQCLDREGTRCPALSGGNGMRGSTFGGRGRRI